MTTQYPLDRSFSLFHQADLLISLLTIPKLLVDLCKVSLSMSLSIVPEEQSDCSCEAATLPLKIDQGLVLAVSVMLDFSVSTFRPSGCSDFCRVHFCPSPSVWQID